MSTDYTKLRTMLSRHEGRVRSAYQDTQGYWTIGVGHLIDVRRGGGLPEHIIDALLDYDIDAHVKGLESQFPWVKDLDEVRYAVLVDMAFNLGVEGLAKFTNTLRLVREGNYQEASEEMLKSRWASQVGKRANRLSQMMATGRWES